MTSNPHSVGGHGYIIIVIDYFTEWAKVMPTYNNEGLNMAQFLFNRVISQSSVLKEIITNHGSHFKII